MEHNLDTEVITFFTHSNAYKISNLWIIVCLVFEISRLNSLKMTTLGKPITLLIVT